MAETVAAFERDPDSVVVSSYAEVVDDIEVTDGETLRKLEPFHLWTENYAEERLKWKKNEAAARAVASRLRAGPAGRDTERRAVRRLQVLA
ncbi:DUF1802 family protein [Cohnella ginsengisoli]|uniref:DUF1802 family protein n=1 Tax=Cohnella ginsengisoli TaxID=425004 RepID=A0A9X4KE56_9BACL|nr:DUF1802 family protein [Cohnella ginsengisoli]MDG0790270.1 DUF1802 family protein [Cohnella ginsengisoli]